MALYKPKTSNNTGGKYYGVCELAILGFKDRSGEFDWADIWIDIEVKQKGSDYTKTLGIKGSLEKDSNGDVTGGTVLKRMYHAFDQLGVKAGVNIKGEFETAEGEKIPDIAMYLTSECTETGFPDDMETQYDYIAYVYKEKPKQAGGKVYTRVHPRLYKNTPENTIRLTEEMAWTKNKGYIKEATAEDISNVPTDGETELQGAGIGSL